MIKNKEAIIFTIIIVIVLIGIVISVYSLGTKAMNICNRAGYDKFEGVDFMVFKCVNKSIANNGLYVYDYENAVTIRLKDYNKDGTRR